MRYLIGANFVLEPLGEAPKTRVVPQRLGYQRLAHDAHGADLRRPRRELLEQIHMKTKLSKPAVAALLSLVGAADGREFAAE